jgi:prepilin-type N-terminal cleavage/methylation domain-containing protein/prepilin-type processing-associated H-X9-DG protein
MVVFQDFLTVFIRKMFMKNRTHKNRGFTLVELLVVISIIAVLLAVLMPAMGKARRLAQRAVCMSRLQQLTLSGMAYSQSNNGKFPHQYADRKNSHFLISEPITTTDLNKQDNWVRHIFPYVKKGEHLHCPVLKRPDGDGGSDPNQKYYVSYNCNGVIAQFGGANTKRTSETVVYFDSPGSGNSSVLRPFYSNSDASSIRTGRYWTGWMRYSGRDALHPQVHDGGRCYSFLDGHVEYAKWQDVTSLRFGLLIGRQYIDGQEPDVEGYNADSRTGAIKW